MTNIIAFLFAFIPALVLLILWAAMVEERKQFRAYIKREKELNLLAIKERNKVYERSRNDKQTR